MNNCQNCKNKNDCLYFQDGLDFTGIDQFASVLEDEPILLIHQGMVAGLVIHGQLRGLDDVYCGLKAVDYDDYINWRKSLLIE